MRVFFPTDARLGHCQGVHSIGQATQDTYEKFVRELNDIRELAMAKLYKHNFVMHFGDGMTSVGTMTSSVYSLDLYSIDVW